MEKEGFIKYLQSKDFAQSTQEECLLKIKLFFQWVGKEDVQVTKPDVLKFLEYLKNKGLQNVTRQFYLNALNHYFTMLYQAEKIAKNPCLFLKIRGIQRKKLYKIYTPEELEQIFDAYEQLFVRNYNYNNNLSKNCIRQSVFSRERNALILSILINQGISTSEIEKIELNDIDFSKATIKIRGGKMLKDRVLQLKATQIGLFMKYLQKTRPQLLEYQKIESEKLFVLLPAPRKRKAEDGSLTSIFRHLASQVKSIDKQFINFLQVRASVITFWLKTQGLRKTQYLAGHRHISNTEMYVNNNLDGLIDDINKLHPFDF